VPTREKRTGSASNRAYNHLVKYVLRWIWPVYGFIFPLLFWPGNDVNQNHQLRVGVTIVFMLVGGVLEFHLYGLPRWRNLIQRHPLPFLALLYGMWTIVSSAFSPSPITSLTGDLHFMTDGAVWTLCLCFLSCLVYTRTRRDRNQERPLVIAVISSGVVLSILALIETVTRKGIVYPYITPSALPVVTFPGPGHLGGFLAISGALAVGWWFRSRQVPIWAWLAVFITAFGLTLTNRRATLIAFAASLVAGLKQPARMLIVAVALGIGIVAGQRLTVFTAAEGVRSFGQTETLKTRSFLWKAALNGIAARPLTGWGGSSFLYAWHRYLSKKDLNEYLKLEFGYTSKRVKRITETPGADQWIFLENQDGKEIAMTLNLWKAHNQFLDVALMWGLVGLALYGMMAALTLRNFYLPGIVALACYQIFLLAWYVPLEAEGIVFLLVGFTTAMGYRPESVRQPDLKPLVVQT
jgi:O-antigen ligase